VGVITGNNTEMIYRTLIKKAGVDSKKIREVEISFDLATFLTGVYDVRPAYIFDETVSLDQQGIKYTIVKPQDYGVQFIGTVYFTKRETVQKDPELVQKFVNSIASGWENALKNPEQALSFLGKYNNTIDVNRERQSFSKGMDYFRGENGKVLMVSQDRWVQMGNSLKELGVIKEVNINFIDNSFIDKYHTSKK
jgi:ABC-type nitrate/sulfonate/bicarbonate transport system substrate-binding protein